MFYKFQQFITLFIEVFSLDMFRNISFSALKIHGISNGVLGEKFKNKDFIDHIMDLDFIFLTETWCNNDIIIPGFKTDVSDIVPPHTDRSCRKSGGISL